MARIAGVNIPQNKLVQVGLTYIYGIGDNFSKQICSALEIPRSKRVNELTDVAAIKPEIEPIKPTVGTVSDVEIQVVFVCKYSRIAS